MSILVTCQYDNQTFGINQLITTSNCEERCKCQLVNGTGTPNCTNLCENMSESECEPHTEIIKENLVHYNWTSCTCKIKKCVLGKFTGTNLVSSNSSRQSILSFQKTKKT